MPNPEPEKNRLMWLIAAAAFLVCLAAGAATVDAPGITWDEASDLRSASDAAHWARNIPRRPIAESFSREALLNGWGNDWKHGPASRAIHAGAWLLVSNFSSDKWFREVAAFRMGTVFAFALLCAMAALAGFRAGGAGASVTAAALLISMPRVFAHSHLCATDVVASMLFFAAALAAWKAAGPVKSLKWAAAFGLLLALAALAKETGALLIPLFIILMAVKRPPRWPLKIILALFIATVGYFRLQPTYWAAPAESASRYFGYILHGSSGVSVWTYYFSTRYTFSPPWHYPFVMLGITTPVLTLALFLIGIASSLRSVPSNFRASVLPCFRGKSSALSSELPCLSGKSSSSGFALWMAACFLSVPVFFALPMIPAYDNERLLLPCCAFMSVLAGLGAARVAALLKPVPGRAAIALFILISVFTLHKARPMEHVYFNQLIGGLPGAVLHGMDVDYWGASVDRTLVGEINRTLPAHARLSAVGYNPQNLVFYQGIGLLRSDISVVDYSEPALAVLICNRPGVFDRRAWLLFQRVRPVTAVLRRGVLLAGVFPAKNASP